MTLTRTGQEGKQTAVYDRTGNSTEPANFIAGTWTSNEVKSAQRDPAVITYTADGANGVRFSAPTGFGYRAQFDGKDYPTQYSRDDAVSLKLVDKRTVEESWKRQGKVADSTRWVVSPDGRELTMTSEGVLPNGTRYKAKEVYRKQ